MEISKSDESQYRKEVREGIETFSQSFEGANNTKNFPEKKALFERATLEAMQAIDDAAKAMMHQKILEQKTQLQKDYNLYLKQPTPEHRDNVQQDIQTFKKILK